MQLALSVRLPRLVRYQLPPQLAQWRVVVPADKKPLALIALLKSMLGVPVIVFTASARGACIAAC